MSANAVFLDTAGLIGVLNADDWLHEKARRAFEEIGIRGRAAITTNLVLAELANSLARSPSRALVSQFIEDLLQEKTVSIVFVDKSLFREGLAKYSQANDKEWGLVDCVSFVVMHRAGIRDAFTADHHFRQAGFNPLLK